DQHDSGGSGGGNRSPRPGTRDPARTNGPQKPILEPWRRLESAEMFARGIAERPQRRGVTGAGGATRDVLAQLEDGARVQLAVQLQLDERSGFGAGHDPPAFLASPPSLACSSRRARESRDITVPMGAPVTSAIS